LFKLKYFFLFFLFNVNSTISTGRYSIATFILVFKVN
jgi:hypothetical protein